MVGHVYTLGAVQALFFAVLTLFKKNKTRADGFLAGFFLLMAVSLLFAFSDTIELYKSYPEMMPLIVLVPLLYGPVLYFYVYELTARPGERQCYHFHLIPVALFYLIMSPAFFNQDELLASFTERFIDLPFYINLGVTILYLSAPVYFVFILRMLQKQRAKNKASCSGHENIKRKWLSCLVLGAIFLWSLEVARIVYANYISQTLPVTLNAVVKTAYVVFIFLLGFYGLRQRNVFLEELTIDRHEKANRRRGDQSKSRVSTLGDEGASYVIKLLQYLETEQPYLYPNLKLLDVALALDIAPHVLSCVINEKFHKNFLAFINGYRVEHAKNMLIACRFSNKTILAIAYDCGFNSKSSFNRVFKEQTGLTPTMFLKMVVIG